MTFSPSPAKPCPTAHGPAHATAVTVSLVLQDGLITLDITEGAAGWRS